MKELLFCKVGIYLRYILICIPVCPAQKWSFWNCFAVQGLLITFSSGMKTELIYDCRLCRCHSNVGLQINRSVSKSLTGQKLSTFWKSDPVEIEETNLVWHPLWGRKLNSPAVPVVSRRLSKASPSELSGCCLFFSAGSLWECSSHGRLILAGQTQVNPSVLRFKIPIKIEGTSFLFSLVWDFFFKMSLT